ncbi:hypothetical protein K353_05343 [Kitasatospora sp. SolWspMP-SS2h]|uniref:hypothetical protein n=1 Tax=Kitasatospora sp. SolWspMP-SS2h TaxID=1305729 RepID=UPI000DBACB4B|nr:hypothetical protein [Kitasatospora sp. SolWspMP-SS2h]RAJ34529.1 hypothetical protein K353_05343 [Kitasatospora sp. SolWspMP-SS2h]
MTRTSDRRARIPLAAAAAVSLVLLTPGTSGAATGTPTVPTDLYNSLRACSTDPGAPLFANGSQELTVEAIAGSTDPSTTRLTAQFRYWPVTDPAQAATVDHPYAVPGLEASARLPQLADATDYAWQARTIDPATGSASDWSASCYVTTDNTAPAAAPAVSSPNYPEGQWNPGGTPLEFRFDPNGVADIAGYQFSWTGTFPVSGADIGEHGIPAYHGPYEDPQYGVRAENPGGGVTVRLVPPAGWSSGPVRLLVRALDRAGNLSQTTTYSTYIRTTSPTVTELSPAPAFGEPVGLRFTPDPDVRAAGPVASYTVYDTSTYRTTVVPAGPDGTAETTLLLNSPVGDQLQITSTSANGWISSAATWGGYLDTTPTITSTDFPEYEAAGAVGTPGTFHLAPKIDGGRIASYTYSLGWNTDQVTVPAGPQGEADISYTPTASGWFDLEVYATTTDGTQLTTGTYTFVVN